MSNVWPFTKQPYKYGYINNPNWTESPAHTDRHSPCGYWPVGADISLPERVIYGPLFGAGANYNYQLGFGTVYQYQETFLQTGDSSFFVKAISAQNYSFALRSNGSLWCVGPNGTGELGLGDTTARTVWTQVPGSWMDFACSYAGLFTLAIKTNGTLWSTGKNNYGQLGLNDEVDRNVFTQVGTSTKWRKVDCGSFYSMAINDDGNIFATGNSYQGATGLGYGSGKEKEFTYVSTISNVDRVSCGVYSTALIKTDGSLWVTGSNSDGQHGLGDTTARTIFTKVTDAGNGVIDFCMGWNDVNSYNGVLFVIKSDKTLWAAGSNLYNIMGIADTSDRLNLIQISTASWSKVSSKDNSAMGIRLDGTLWGGGKNALGELGLNDRIARTEWEQVGTDLWLSIYTNRSSMGIKWDGTYVWV